MCKQHNKNLYLRPMNKIDSFVADGFTQYLPGQSIDCVIIGYNEHGLNVLTLNWKEFDMWALPGGFIHNKEDMDQAAIRILKERTGLELAFLKQFYTFGNYNRRDFEEFLKQFEPKELKFQPFINWMKQRFISTGYLALVDMKKCNPTPDFLTESCDWKPINNLPKLLFDHQHIIEKALEQIRIQINYLPIGLSLLPEKFTMKDLQKLYESILQKELDRGNFQKKILKLGFLDRLEKQLSGRAHKAPYLYKFNETKYDYLLKKGIGFIS